MERWEEVANDPWTLRLRVPGGWLYCVVALSDNGSQYRNAVTFVPDDRAQREEDVDPYNAGPGGPMDRVLRGKP